MQSILTAQQRAVIDRVGKQSEKIAAIVAEYRAPADMFTQEEYFAGKYSEAKAHLWNEYIYPHFLPVFNELFPDAKRECEYEGMTNMIRYGEMMGAAFCEWLDREGFFHSFEENIYFVLARNVFEVYPAGASFILFELDQAADALNSFSRDATKSLLRRLFDQA